MQLSELMSSIVVINNAYTPLTCPFCGFTNHHNNNQLFIFTPTPSTPLTQEQMNEFYLHTLGCTLRMAKKLNIDTSDLLSNGCIIHRVENDDDDNATILYEEKKYEMQDEDDDEDDDEDLEQEILDLEEDCKKIEEFHNKQVIKDGDNDNIKLKFKFMNGMLLEGLFKRNTSLSELTEWISLKSGMIKELIGLRIKNQLFENRKILENKSTLQDLNIENNLEIKCLVRTV